jgi:hypothetical protein
MANALRRGSVLAFEQLADHFRAETRLSVSVEYLTTIGGSSLTDLRIPVATGKPARGNSDQLRSVP